MFIDEILNMVNNRIALLEEKLEDAEGIQRERLDAEIREARNAAYIIRQMYPKPTQIWLNGPNIAVNWDDGVSTSAVLMDGDLWHLEAGVFLALLKRFIPYSTAKRLIRGIREENITDEAYERLRRYADIRRIYGEKISEEEKPKK